MAEAIRKIGPIPPLSGDDQIGQFKCTLGELRRFMTEDLHKQLDRIETALKEGKTNG